ncbi:MAG: hypothetical protein L0154_12785 [Chloroflexi bacterium]|nr:hypothetical protein [Chloroflexota bacterium]
MKRLSIVVVLLLLWVPIPPTEAVQGVIDVPLTITENAGIARSQEVVRSGIPLPTTLNLTNTSSLAIVDQNSQPVPAEFEVLGRWNAALNNSSASIRWLLVTFPASVGANSSVTYRLVANGTVNPAPQNPVTVTQNGNLVTVNTGEAIFTLGVDRLFNDVQLTNGRPIISGGTMTLTTGGQTYVNNNGSRLQVNVEHSGPLMAVVTVKGAYNAPAVGGGLLSSFRRYEFRWNSTTAIIRHAVNWEGELCTAGTVSCGNAPDGVLIGQVRDTLVPAWTSDTYSTIVIGNRSLPAQTGNVTVGTGVSIEQLRRSDRFEPVSYRINGVTEQGKATGAMLGIQTGSYALVIALNHMHRYEPQALRLTPNGTLAVDIASSGFYISKRQGFQATMAVGACETIDQTELERDVWAPLNHPLRAWPSTDWFHQAGAFDELPVGALTGSLSNFDAHVGDVMNLTLTEVDSRGLPGLMTFGSYPRYWADPIRTDELDCNDSTPQASWDNAFWCGTWTDYHNTIASSVYWAMRSGDTLWLDEISVPGALRMLHTQIYQCSPTDTYFYCGQAPAGYAGFRSDFNSSHAYFENLILYYWLTGDETVVNTLKRGANTMRDFLCPGRFNGQGAMCGPNQIRTDEWAFLVGRSTMQWYEVFRFLAMASDDASYQQDWHGNLARAVTQHYVQVISGGTEYGFWLPAAETDSNGNIVWPPRPLNGGTFWTDQLWIASLYDMNNLYRYMVDTNDAPLGDPAIQPSEILVAWANTLVDFGSTIDPGGGGWPPGNGTPSGSWPNNIVFNWSGPRIGGTLNSTSVDLSGSDPHLYNTGKASLTAVLMRAAVISGDADILNMACSMTAISIQFAQSEFLPLGKIQGEYLARLPAAVALASQNCSN